MYVYIYISVCVLSLGNPTRFPTSVAKNPVKSLPSNVLALVVYGRAWRYLETTDG